MAIGIAREVLVVDGSAVAEQIQQHDARKPHPVFRRALDFGLVLMVNLAASAAGMILPARRLARPRFEGAASDAGVLGPGVPASLAEDSPERRGCGRGCPAGQRTSHHLQLPAQFARFRRGIPPPRRAFPRPCSAVRAPASADRGRAEASESGGAAGAAGQALAPIPQTLIANRNNAIALDPRIQPDKRFLSFTIRLPKKYLGSNPMQAC